jgi:hypothetical protein
MLGCVYPIGTPLARKVLFLFTKQTGIDQIDEEIYRSLFSHLFCSQIHVGFVPFTSGTPCHVFSTTLLYRLPSLRLDSGLVLLHGQPQLSFTTETGDNLYVSQSPTNPPPHGSYYVSTVCWKLSSMQVCNHCNLDLQDDASVVWDFCDPRCGTLTTRSFKVPGGHCSDCIKKKVCNKNAGQCKRDTRAAWGVSAETR